LNVFLGFFEAAGYFAGLNIAFVNSGYKPEEYFYFDNKFQYSTSDYTYFKILRRLYVYAGRANYFVRNVSKLFFNFFSFFFFLYSLFKFDYFFFSSQSFFFYWSSGFEFKILKFFKKKSVFIFLGSDSRAPFLSGYNKRKDEATLVHLTRQKINFLNSFKLKTDFVIDLPPSSLLHPVPVIDFYKIGFPKVIEAAFPRPISTRRVKVLHAPSVQEYKGSDVFRNIISELKESLDFEYIEVSNLANVELLKIIKDCDLVIDELYSDSLMAGIACESAWLGTCYVVFGEKLPTMASHYKWHVRNMGHPEDAKAMIKEFILNHELRYETAVKNFEFVTTNWSPEIVVKKLIKIANRDFDKDMFIEPGLIEELCYGWGASRKDIHVMLDKLKSYPDISSYIDRLNTEKI
jgi:hypothetical protein